MESLAAVPEEHEAEGDCRTFQQQEDKDMTLVRTQHQDKNCYKLDSLPSSELNDSGKQLGVDLLPLNKLLDWPEDNSITFCSP